MQGPYFQIAIDGPAASGKSSVAKLLAKRLGAFYLNTGDMYRAVGRIALDAGIDPAAAPEQVTALLAQTRLALARAAGNSRTLEICIDGRPIPRDRLRTPEAARAASLVARIPEVRRRLAALQRSAARLGPVVAEGRDMGTVVFPRALRKFFLTASPEIRARRRLAQDGRPVTESNVRRMAAEIAERDRRDSTRTAAPLRPAEDAVIVDTGALTVDQVVRKLLENIPKTTNRNP